MLSAIARIAGARLMIGIIIAGAIGVGGFFLRDFASGSVTELKVGDCFDLPADKVQTVEEVQHHPCTEAHTAELVGLVDYPSNDGAPYPDDTSLENFATNECVAFFRSYTARDPYTDTELTLGWLVPTLDGWSHGDHGISCHLMRVDEGSMTNSYRAPQS